MNLEQAKQLLKLNGAQIHDLHLVKKHYRTLAKFYHPDADTGSEEKFKQLQEAYTLVTSYDSSNSNTVNDYYKDILKKDIFRTRSRTGSRTRGKSLHPRHGVNFNDIHLS